MNLIEKTLQETGVAATTGSEIKTNFQPFFDQVNDWKEKAEALIVTDVEQTDLMKQAREGRLALKNIRVSADKKRKELKEDSLRYGKAVQGVYNLIEYAIKPLELHLEKQEKFAEIKEKERIDALRELRESEVEPLREFVPYGIDLGMMTDEDYNKLVDGAKLQIKAKKEAEAKAEAERIERERKEAEEREAIRKENELLKKEAEAAAAKAEAERIEREKAERAAKAEAERLEAIRKAEEAKKQAEHEAQLRAEREAREKIEREAAERQAALEKEIADKKKAEELAANAEAERIESELSKGDEAKFNDLLKDLADLKTKYSFKSAKNKTMYSQVGQLLDKVINHITK